MKSEPVHSEQDEDSFGSAFQLDDRVVPAGIHCGYNRAMSTRVLLVNNAVHRHLFKPTWHWRTHLKGIETQSVHLPSGDRPPDLAAFSHIILTGSEASILDPKPWFETESALIREAVDRGIPILGSCFGHQMLVYSLAGPQFLQASKPPEVGWANIEMTGSTIVFCTETGAPLLM